MSPGSSLQSILIVDDTPENIDILKGILAGHYHTRVTTHGRGALKVAFAESPPDLILLDVMMPGLDGYEVCRLLKADERTRGIPVIFVTAKSSPADESFGFAIGAADYISKPISPPVVLARIRTHLALADRSRHLEELVRERTESLLARTRELEATRLEIIQRLGRAGEFRDNETGRHLTRMSLYSRLLARQCGLTDYEAEQLMQAAILHDIGKIGIPDAILLKPGPLTPDEFEVIREHCRIGAEIIGEHSCPLLRTAAEIAMTHHERWDGSGYPRRLAGEEIPLAGRITAIADVFDALISSRPYKAAWTLDEAFALIARESGRSFDPSLVPLFLALRSELKAVVDTFQEVEPAP